MKKFYKIVADINDDNGIDFNAFVNNPAHMKGFIAFNKNHSYTFSEEGERRIVTGVMISANTQIFRNFNDGHESYVSFSKEAIDIFRKKFFKNGFVQNVNNEHTSNVIKGATMIDSYVIDSSNPNYPKAPEAFEKQRLADGTWIASYWVTDDKVWEKVKDGTFNGFSVEGYLDKVEIKVKTNMGKTKLLKGKFAKISQISKWDLEVDQDDIKVGTKLTQTHKDFNDEPITSNVMSGEYTLETGKSILVDSNGLVRLEFKNNNKSTQMKNKKKTVLDYLGFSNFNKDKFAEATTADGIVLFYEGELTEGETAFTIESEGEQMPAPEGEHQITLEDGSVKIINLDASGVLVTVTDFIEENVDDTELATELRKETALALEKVSKDLLTAIDERFNKVEAKFTALSKDEKFKHQGKKTDLETKKAGFKSLLNNKK